MRTLLVGLAIAALPGCFPAKGPASTRPDSNWWTAMGDIRRSGQAENLAVLTLRLRWTLNLVPSPEPHEPLFLQPVVGQDRIFVPAVHYLTADLQQREVRIHALSRRDGSLSWTFAARREFAMTGAPAAANGRVYFATLGGGVYALDAETGEPAWSASLPRGCRDSVVVAHLHVYVKTEDQRIHALRQHDGRVVWSASGDSNATAHYNEAAPSIAMGKVIALFNDGLYAFDISDGRRAWKFPRADLATVTPVVLMDVGVGNAPLVYAVATDERVHAVEVSTGLPRMGWVSDRRTVRGASALVLADRRLHIYGTTDVKVLDALTGSETGSFPVDPLSGVRKWPAISGGIFYYASREHLRGVRISDGMGVVALAIPGNRGGPPWRGSGSEPGWSPPSGLAVDRGVYVANHGHVYAFDAGP